MPRLSLLIAGGMCPPHIGGVETVIENTSKILAKLGHEVQVLCCHETARESIKHQTLDNVELIKWPVKSYKIPKNSKELENYLINTLKDTNVLHLHNVHNPFIYFVWKAWKKLPKNARPKFIITPHYHGTGHTLLAKILWIPWHIIVRNVLKSADRVHAVSEYEKSMLEKDFRMNPVVIEHGISEDVLQYKWRPEDYLVYAGRIEKYKRLDYIVYLVRELENSGLSLRLVLIGKGRYLHNILFLAKKLGIELEHLDFLPRHEYLRWLSQAVAFINLSKHEAYSLTTLEVVTMGVPAIVAEPWGRHFTNKGRVLILNVKKDMHYIAKVVSTFLKGILLQQEQHSVERLCMPRLWRDVVYDYLVKLYN